jgi:hypothetical protein
MKQTFIFSWTTLNGERSEIGFTGCTKQEAIDRALEWGWTPPKWWQWWRWDDQPRKILIINGE